MSNLQLDHRSRNSGWIGNFWYSISRLLAVAAFSCYLRANPTGENPQILVHQVVENELQAQMKPLHWRYVSQKQEVEERRTEIVVQTRQGMLRRLVFHNGQRLTPRQQEQETRRIRELIHSPRDLGRQAYEHECDQKKILSLLKMLPTGLIYTWEASDGQKVRLGFRPNPDFVPPTFEAKVFHALQGIMVVDGGHKRLIELHGRLSRDVSFGWGIFGKLRKGGTVELRQEQVEPGQWEMTFLDINVTGKVWLFKTIGMQWEESCSAFQRVPESITLEDAAEILMRDVQSVIRVQPSS